MTYHTIIQIYYGGDVVGQMDKQDSQNIREYWDSGRSADCTTFMELQSKYQEEHGIDDMLDFVDPEYDTAVKNGRDA